MSDFMTQVLQNIDLAQKLGKINGEVESVAESLLEVIRNGGTIFIAGNAGAGSNAEHFVSELVGRFYKTRKPLKAISLNSDNTTMTCIGNDFGFDEIFVRQLEALFDPEKDVFIGMTTSGNSKNIYKAAHYAVDSGGKAINLLGADGGLINRAAHINQTNIIIPTYDTPRIQEAHMFVLHYWAEYIEKNMFEEGV